MVQMPSGCASAFSIGHDPLPGNMTICIMVGLMRLRRSTGQRHLMPVLSFS
jgi:hypothetical protein